MISLPPFSFPVVFFSADFCRSDEQFPSSPLAPPFTEERVLTQFPVAVPL